MKKLICNLLIAGATAALFAASASAQLMINGVGSSAEFQAASLAAFQLAGGTGSGAGHWTASNAGKIHDTREPGIPDEQGNLAIVWDPTGTKVWSYLSVDSVVGNRAYFAAPRTTLLIPAPMPAAGQKISAGLWGADTATASIPPNVLVLLAPSGIGVPGAQFSAAYTDILPADAKFAQNRVNCGTAATATIGCLGYGSADPHLGVPIQSAFSATVANPVDFNIYGSDPITGSAVHNYTVVPIGIAPLLIIANRTNASGLGQSFYSDMTYQSTAQLLWTGTYCDGTAFGFPSGVNYLFAVYPGQREPLSGTMNTFEFNFMVQNGQGLVSGGYFSQESIFNPPYFDPSTFGAIPPAANNPLNGACSSSSYAVGPQGRRMRAIGTGEMVSAIKGTAPTYTDAQDRIGYIFFGYGNVSSIANSSNWGYLQYQLIDPVNPSGNYAVPYVSGGLNWPGNGELPVCTAPCGIGPNLSFPNVRNGAYRNWSLLRAVADSGSAALTNLQALATTAQNQINSTQPDFLPFNAASDGDLGFIGYRVHFDPNPSPTGTGPNGSATFSFNATNTPNNGITVPSAEAGGDVGGCLDYKYDPNPTGCRY